MCLLCFLVSKVSEKMVKIPCWAHIMEEDYSIFCFTDFLYFDFNFFEHVNHLETLVACAERIIDFETPKLGTYFNIFKNIWDICVCIYLPILFSSRKQIFPFIASFFFFFILSFLFFSFVVVVFVDYSVGFNDYQVKYHGLPSLYQMVLRLDEKRNKCLGNATAWPKIFIFLADHKSLRHGWGLAGLDLSQWCA